MAVRPNVVRRIEAPEHIALRNDCPRVAVRPPVRRPVGAPVVGALGPVRRIEELLPHTGAVRSVGYLTDAAPVGAACIRFLGWRVPCSFTIFALGSSTAAGELRALDSARSTRTFERRMTKILSPRDQRELEYLYRRCLLIVDFAAKADPSFTSAPALRMVVEQTREAANLRGMRTIRSDLLDLSHALAPNDQRTLRGLLDAQASEDPFPSSGAV